MKIMKVLATAQIILEKFNTSRMHFWRGGGNKALTFPFVNKIIIKDAPRIMLKKTEDMPFELVK